MSLARTRTNHTFAKPNTSGSFMRRMALFWLVFLLGLVSVGGLLLWISPAPQLALSVSGALPPKLNSNGNLFGIDEIPTDTPVPPPPTDTPNAPPTDTPVPLPPTDTPVSPPTNTPIPPTEVIPPTVTQPAPPTRTPFITLTPVPPTPTAAIDTPEPQITLTYTPIPVATTARPPTSTSVPPVTRTFTPPAPTMTATAVKPTADIKPTSAPEEPPTPTRVRVTLTLPPPTAIPSPPTPTRKPTNRTPTPESSPTITPVVISVDITATIQVQIDQTATAIVVESRATSEAAVATANAAIATARATSASNEQVATAEAAQSTAVAAAATSNPQTPLTGDQIPTDYERAISRTIAADPQAPILIYTYTQQVGAGGVHLVAACVLNVGNAAAANITTTFAATEPAVMTGMRIPNEASAFSPKNSSIRIGTLPPRFMKQMEVAVGNVDAPLPNWITVTVANAYLLNRPNDPPFPVACTPEGIEAATSDFREVNVVVSEAFERVAKVREEQARVPNRVVSVASADGNAADIAFGLQPFYWIIGTALTLLLLVFLLGFLRRRRTSLQV